MTPIPSSSPATFDPVSFSTCSSDPSVSLLICRISEENTIQIDMDRKSVTILLLLSRQPDSTLIRTSLQVYCSICPRCLGKSSSALQQLAWNPRVVCNV